MSDFLNSEAEESSDEETKPPKSKKVLIDSDEEEEDDEQKIAEEMADLINDEEEEEEEVSGSDDGGEREKNKRKHDDSDLDDQLEDEDYDLLEENLGYKVKRQPKKLKRIRMLSDDEDSGKEEGDERDVIANELFEGHEEEPGEEGEERPEEDLEVDEEEESDVDDFIVDEDGHPISKRGKKKRHIIHTDKALQQAQDIFGVDFDFEEFDQFEDYEEEDDLEEDEEYEEDEEEASRRKNRKAARKMKKKSIFDVYEPSELERGHFTDRDNEIRETDIPERFQLRKVPVKPADKSELESEADWIYRHAFATTNISVQEEDEDISGRITGLPRKGPKTIEKIREALNCMRNQQFEVPFIAFYRKEYVEPELNINDLWKVWQWDEKWTQLKTRRERMAELFEKMQNWQFEQFADPDKPLDTGVRALTEEDVDRILVAQTMEELNDVHQHFLLYYGRDVPKMRVALREKRRKEGQEMNEDPEHDDIPKQASRKSGYTLCIQSGLAELAKKFGLSIEQFAENLRDNYQRHEIDQFSIEPLEYAKEFVSERFPTPEEVLAGARHMVAMMIAHDPTVHQVVRTVFYERAKLSVAPTVKGVKEIDEGHQCYTFKYLKNKPVKDLRYDQFLKLVLAEEEKMLTISISLDDGEPGSQTYFDEVKSLYHRDEFSKLVQEWNDQRSQTLERAFNKILYPQLVKELRARLLFEAKDHVMKSCCHKLYNWLKVAPYQPEQPLDDDEDYMEGSKGLKVLGVAFSPQRDVPAFCGLVDGDGEVLDFCRLPNILKRRNAFWEDERKHKQADMDKLKKFITKKKPHVIVVGADCREALNVVEDIKRCVSELEEEQQIPNISVELMDNELAVLFANTKKSTAEFREYPELLKQAISLARRLQDPLIEFCQMCDVDEDILSLKYHPLQEKINKDELQEALYLEFINRVNEVGVDVNKCITHPHLAPQVQFICGLGPRKGYHCLKLIKQIGRLENRGGLVTGCNMGPKIFINCAGFVKIDTNMLGDSTDNYVEVLDGSRVHPETYDWARKMAVDALEYDDTAADANPAGALEEILDSPERLGDLDLDAFAEELERQGFGNKNITLYDIRAELHHRYKDLRLRYEPPTVEERFNILTRETPQTFYIGKLIMCTCIGIAHKKPRTEELDNANPVRDEETGMWQCPFCRTNTFAELSEVWSHFDAGICQGSAVGVKARLDNGVSGFIHTKMVSDKNISNPEERVKHGQILHARISKIDIERLQVDLTCRSSDLLDQENKWKLQKDLYYDQEREDADREKERDKRKSKARQTYIKRVIVHPSFHNIGFKECEKLIARMEQGEVIVRPSSKGSDHLTVTWKVAEGISQHIDVQEEMKENAFSLGKKLLIGNEEFEDLDEIIARHVQPMAALARDMVNYKYFLEGAKGAKEHVEKLLKEEKKKSLQKIPYYIAGCKELPGKFLLSYMPRIKARHEFLTVTPNGIRYRGHNFRGLSSLIRWFKEHFRDPIPGTPQTIRTPMTQNINATPLVENPNLRAIPNTFLSSLAQVAGAANATPHLQPSMGFYQTPLMTPLMTPIVNPALQAGATPSMTTPRYQQQQQQQQQQQWMQQKARSGLTPRSGGTPRAGQTPKGGQAGMDWAKAAAMWAKRKQDKPRTPRDRTPNMGDGTPLIDET